MIPALSDSDKAVLKLMGLGDIPENLQVQAMQIGNNCAASYSVKGDLPSDKAVNLQVNQFAKNISNYCSDLLIEKAENPLKARQLQESIDQAKLKSKELDRLRCKMVIKRTQKTFEDLEVCLRLGIENINRKVSLAEELKCHPIHLTEEDIAQKADQIMQELIQEEEKEAKKRSRSSRRKKLKSAKKQSIVEKTSSPNKKTEKAVKAVAQLTLSLDAKLSKFALKLMEDSFKCPEHSRITRWKTKDLRQIRHFVDCNPNGQKILHYQDFTDAEIIEQRMKHFLPGTERLLKDSTYRNIYTFPTDRGVGLVAQLVFNHLPRNGILYLGVDDNSFVFHKYFEDVDFQDSQKNVFQDAVQVLNENEETDKQGNWITQHDFRLDISKTGILEFTYTDYTLHVYPIRQDLFEKTLSDVF